MKAIYLTLLMVGIVLTFGMEGLNAAPILGVVIMAHSCEKLNLFNKNII